MALGAARPAIADAPKAPPLLRTDLSVLPIISYDADGGFYFGALTIVARFEPGYVPYRARIEAQASASVKPGPHDEVDFPDHYDFVEVDLPGLPHGLRLRSGVVFRRRLIGFRGVGNAPAAIADGEPVRSDQYRHTSLLAALGVRATLIPRLFLRSRIEASWNELEVFSGSRLARGRSGALGAATRRALRSNFDHALVSAQISVEWDDRDDETYPMRGMFHSLSLTGAVEGEGRFGFGLIRGAVRAYVPLLAPWLVLATRLEATFGVGDVPVYALPRLGGADDLRGVPLGWYHGRVRFLGTLELRALLVDFRLFGQVRRFGLVSFLDIGRVWADYDARPELDGDQEAMQFAVGGGLRLVWGQALLIRVDVGWSPDDWGIYLATSQAF